MGGQHDNLVLISNKFLFFSLICLCPPPPRPPVKGPFSDHVVDTWKCKQRELRVGVPGPPGVGASLVLSSWRGLCDTKQLAWPVCY